MPSASAHRSKRAGLIAWATIAVMALAPDAAWAQDPDSEPDPTARYDIDAALGRHPHDVSDLPDAEEARGRRVTFDLVLAGTYATNAGTSRFNAIDAGYVTPGFGIDVTPVNLGGWEIGGGALVDADFYGGGHDHQFGEGRLEAFVFASRPIGPGSMTGEFIALGIFGNDFSQQELALYITNLTFNVSAYGIDLETSVEHQDSDIPDLRRARVTGTMGHTLEERLLGYEVTVEADLAWSDFSSGANSGRRDVTTALVLVAEREVARDWSLEWEAAVVRRFSNRNQSEFSALDLGVEIARRF